MGDCGQPEADDPITIYPVPLLSHALPPQVRAIPN